MWDSDQLHWTRAAGVAEIEDHVIKHSVLPKNYRARRLVVMEDEHLAADEQTPARGRPRGPRSLRQRTGGLSHAAAIRPLDG